LDSRVVWEYPCATFVLDDDFGSDGAWLACARCAELIEERLLPALTLRSLKSKEARGEKITGDAIDRIGRIQQGFFDHRNGERFVCKEAANAQQP
jgi:hypothetical protein